MNLAMLIFFLLIKISYVNSTYDASIIKGLLADYDWKSRPFGSDPKKRNGGPLVISVNVLLRTVSKIDDVNMEFSTQFTFRQTWRDHRLAYGTVNLPELAPFEVDTFQSDTSQEDKKLPDFIILVPDDQSEHIWLPDTFFQNEKSAQKHLIDKPNVLIRIYPSGDVLYSVRLSLVLSCPMSLVFYPMDEQDCYIDFSSYAYTMDDIVYQWSNDSPVQMKDTVKTSLPSFDLGDVTTKHCISNTSTGEYSCLRVHLQFKRMFSYYLIQLYIPSFMLVVVSWVSFWVDKSSVPARVTLGVTTLLTITTQASGVNAKLPPVSYTKAIDVWIGVCLAFVFGALLEYALVNYADEDNMWRFSRRGRPMVRHPPESIEGADNSTSLCRCGQPDTQQKRQSITPCGHQQRVQGSPLLGRNNNSYGWSDEEDPNRGPRVPTDSIVSTTPFSILHSHSSSSACPACSTADSQQVRSFADRRLATVQFPSRCSALPHGPLYKRAGMWAVSFYNQSDRAKKIDVVSRVVFPFLFLCFNCIYWTVY